MKLMSLELPMSSPNGHQQALETRYFRTSPICPENILELAPLELPDHDGSYHEFQTKRKRKENGLMQQDAKRAQRKKVRGDVAAEDRVTCFIALIKYNEAAQLWSL